MRYIKFVGDAGIGGTEFEELHVYEDDVPDAIINDTLAEMSDENADYYEYLIDIPDDVDVGENCWWTEYSREEFVEMLGEKNVELLEDMVY